MKEKSIYLLEDDPDIKDLISFILKRDGYKVLAFGKVKDFNNQIEKELPDLFIMDVSLPDGNGLDVTKELVEKKDGSLPPVLLMSADDDNRQKAFVSGASYFMSKPFSIYDLLSKVEILLAA